MASSEKGLSGLQFTGGYVTEELHPNLQGNRELKVYREMSDNDPTIGAIMFAINMLIRQVKWEVEAHPEGDDKDVEFLEDCIKDLDHSWQDFISEVMSMIIYGFSFFEIVYRKRDDGKVGWKKFGMRSQDSLHRWVIDDKTGEVSAFIQKPPPDYQDRVIPLKKAALFRTSSFKDNPQGRSVLRNSYRPWFFKKRIEEIEAIGIERDLAGIPMAMVDADIMRSDAGPEEKAMLAGIENIVKNVRQDKQAGIIWPKITNEDGELMYEFSLLSTGGTRTFDTTRIIQRYDQRITMTVLADFILLGHEKVGSFALSSDKTDLFAVAIGAWLQMIQETIQRQMVVPLFKMNGRDDENLPTMKFGDIERPDLSQLSTFMGAMAQMGMPLFPDSALESWTRKIAGLPEPSEEAQTAFDEAQQAEIDQIRQKAEAGGGSAFATSSTSPESAQQQPGTGDPLGQDEDPFAGLFEDNMPFDKKGAQGASVAPQAPPKR